IAWSQRGELLGQLSGRPVRELARRRVVGQAHGLLRDRLRDLPPPVAHVDHGQAREGIHQLAAARRPEPHALGPVDDELLVGEPWVILRPVGPEIVDLVPVAHARPSSLTRRLAARYAACAARTRARCSSTVSLAVMARNTTWSIAPSHAR